jgi:hypothetical protein
MPAHLLNLIEGVLHYKVTVQLVNTAAAAAEAAEAAAEAAEAAGYSTTPIHTIKIWLTATSEQQIGQQQKQQGYKQ